RYRSRRSVERKGRPEPRPPPPKAQVRGILLPNNKNDVLLSFNDCQATAASPRTRALPMGRTPTRAVRSPARCKMQITLQPQLAPRLFVCHRSLSGREGHSSGCLRLSFFSWASTQPAAQHRGHNLFRIEMLFCDLAGSPAVMFVALVDRLERRHGVCGGVEAEQAFAVRQKRT